MGDNEAKKDKGPVPGGQGQATDQEGQESGTVGPPKEKRTPSMLLILIMKTIAFLFVLVAFILDTHAFVVATTYCETFKRGPTDPKEVNVGPGTSCQTITSLLTIYIFIIVCTAILLILTAVVLALEVVKIIKMKSLISYVFDAMLVYYMGFCGSGFLTLNLGFGIGTHIVGENSYKRDKGNPVLTSFKLKLASGVFGMMAMILYFAICYMAFCGVGRMEADRGVRRLAPGIPIYTGSPSIMGIPPKGQGQSSEEKEA